MVRQYSSVEPQKPLTEQHLISSGHVYSLSSPQVSSGDTSDQTAVAASRAIARADLRLNILIKVSLDKSFDMSSLLSN